MIKVIIDYEKNKVATYEPSRFIFSTTQQIARPNKETGYRIPRVAARGQGMRLPGIKSVFLIAIAHAPGRVPFSG